MLRLGEIYFQVTEVSYFRIDGMLSLEGAKSIQMDVRLRDFTAFDDSVYYNSQTSLFTDNEVFAVGRQEGDFRNRLEGDMYSQLLPGHEYLFQYSLNIRNDLLLPPDSGARAFGYIDFEVSPDRFAPIPAVPVPAAVWLFGTGIIGLIGFSRRRKSA